MKSFNLLSYSVAKDVLLDNRTVSSLYTILFQSEFANELPLRDEKHDTKEIAENDAISALCDGLKKKTILSKDTDVGEDSVDVVA